MIFFLFFFLVDVNFAVNMQNQIERGALWAVWESLMEPRLVRPKMQWFEEKQYH